MAKFCTPKWLCSGLCLFRFTHPYRAAFPSSPPLFPSPLSSPRCSLPTCSQHRGLIDFCLSPAPKAAHRIIIGHLTLVAWPFGDAENFSCIRNMQNLSLNFFHGVFRNIIGGISILPPKLQTIILRTHKKKNIFPLLK